MSDTDIRRRPFGNQVPMTFRARGITDVGLRDRLNLPDDEALIELRGEVEVEYGNQWRIRPGIFRLRGKKVDGEMTWEPVNLTINPKEATDDN